MVKATIYGQTRVFNNYVDAKKWVCHVAGKPLSPELIQKKITGFFGKVA